MAVGLFVLVFLFAYFANNIVYTIEAGNVGVLWKRFGGGTVLDATLPEGLHLVWPWDKVFIYDVRLRQLSQDFDVLSSDGLKLTVNMAYRFQLNEPEVPTLHKFIGPNYADVMLSADIGAQARDIFSQNTPEEIFSDRRVEIKNAIAEAVTRNLVEQFNPPGRKNVVFINLEALLIRSITLPPTVQAAIERKNEQLQLNQEYDYRLLREAKESQRKRIEAQGIKEFQDIISRGITDSYLRWRGIEATLELARSNNSKIVVIGAGKEGLPIILGNVDAPNAPRTDAAPAAGTSIMLPAIGGSLTAPAAATPAAVAPAPAANSGAAAPPEASLGGTEAVAPDIPGVAPESPAMGPPELPGTPSESPGAIPFRPRIAPAPLPRPRPP
jgi:regulator of protease activity HflC (stomatin/prohibitin superfamily)